MRCLFKNQCKNYNPNGRYENFTEKCVWLDWQTRTFWQASSPSTEKGFEGWVHWEMIPGWIQFPKAKWINHNSVDDDAESFDMAECIKQACNSLRGVSMILEECEKENSNVQR